MACVWYPLGRWAMQEVRLHSIGILALTTLLLMLSTNVYLLNRTIDRTVLDENGNFDLNNPKQYVLDEDIRSNENNDENTLIMHKLKSLQNKLSKTRLIIYAQKELIRRKRSKEIKYLEDKPAENNLKRHLMNAGGLDKTFVTMVTTPDQQRFLESVKTTNVLHEKNTYLKSNSSFLSCHDLPENLEVLESIGSGYTKQVKKAEINGRYVALKHAYRRGHDGVECAQYGMSEEDCYRLANYKILKELALVQQLQSPNIIKLLGYCLTDKKEDGTSRFTIATELGEPLTFLALLQMSWEDRLRIAFGITQLLVDLHKSPLGALTVHDFKLSQFVLVNSQIKLADLDDVDDSESVCRWDGDCRISSLSSQPCVDGKCQHFSDRINVYHAHKLFYSLLPFEAPLSVQERVTELTNKTGRAAWASSKILLQLHEILYLYQSNNVYDNIEGASHTSDYNFKKFSNRDFPAIHDYWCHGTIYAGANSCAFSVRDENEAKYLCSRDSQCKAFVMTSQKTWTGRTVVYLKNKASLSAPSPGNTLYLLVTSSDHTSQVDKDSSVAWT